jgi:hypothetical protein
LAMFVAGLWLAALDPADAWTKFKDEHLRPRCTMRN